MDKLVVNSLVVDKFAVENKRLLRQVMDKLFGGLARILKSQLSLEFV